jgi:MFS family permease
LTGFAYTIPFAFMGLYWGGLTNKVNRKWMISIAMAVSALTMGSVGFVNSFAVLAASRFILGFISSIFNPMSFSLLTDYFPADKRATANSIVQSGNYVGWGLSSISIMAIKNFGWRTTYGFLGSAALAVSALFALFVKDPRAKKLAD